MKYFCTILTAIAVSAMMSSCNKSAEQDHEGHDHAGQDHAEHDHAAHAPSAETALATSMKSTFSMKFSLALEMTPVTSDD